MPASQITNEEWARHKDTILRLRSTPGITLTMIRQIIIEQHKFEASPYDYEKIFKRWELRKNLTASEWPVVIRELDRRKRQNRAIGLRINGCLIAPSRIKKARERYCSRQALSTDESNQPLPIAVSFEADGHNSTESSHQPGSSSVDSTIPISSPLSFTRSSTSALNLPPATAPRRPPSTGVATGQVIRLPRNGQSPFSNDMMSFGIPSPRAFDLGGFDIDDILSFGNHAQLSPLPVPLFGLDLPHQGSETPALHLSEFLNSAVSQTELRQIEPYHEEAHGQSHDLLPLRTAVAETEDIKLARLFIGDAIAAAPRPSAHATHQRLPDAEDLLRNLRSLFPTTTIAEAPTQPLNVISGVESCASDFVQLLIFSLANNFAGMEGFPLKAILKFVSQQDQMASNILSYLKDAPSPLAMSLAENMFRVALEAGDVNLLKVVLSTKLVNPNEITCTHVSHSGRKRRLTPIALSVILHDIEISRVLLEYGVDVNNKSSLASGALSWATDSAREDTYEVDVVLVTMLLKHGSLVHHDTIHILLINSFLPHPDATRKFLTRSQAEELIRLIMLYVPPIDHGKLFNAETLRNGGFLSYAVELLQNDLCFEIVRQMIEACAKVGCNQCVRRNRKNLENLIFRAATRGNLKLVEFVYHYVPEPNIYFLGALRSGNRALIDLLVHLGADIDAPASNIDGSQPAWPQQPLTTPLAEAIGLGDEDIVNMLENAGALSNISEPGRFKAAIYAAAGIGDIAYIEKLHRIVPQPTKHLLAYSLIISIVRGHEKAALNLLARGASVNDYYWKQIAGKSRRHGPALREALQIKNKQLVRAIMEMDADANLGCGSRFGPPSTLEAAAAWEDLSLIRDLVSLGAQLDEGCEATALVIAVQRRNKPMAEMLLDLGASINAYSHQGLSPLDVSVALGNPDWVDFLLQNGADPANTKALLAATSQHEHLLNPLIRKFRIQHPQGLEGFGGSILCSVILRSADTLLDLCLGAKLDVNAFSPVVHEIYNRDRFKLPPGVIYRSSNDYVLTSPLGLAIDKLHGHRLDLISKLLDAGGHPDKPARVICEPAFNYDRMIFTETCFLLAIQTHSLPLIELLIKKGASINKPPRLGLKRTPLQQACEIGDYPIIDLLLRHGADVNAAPAARRGGTALQLAAKQGSVMIVNRLIQCGADVHEPRGQVLGHTALEFAAMNGRLNMITTLWDAGEGRFTREEVDSAVSMAKENGHNSCAMLLRERCSQSHSFIES